MSSIIIIIITTTAAASCFLLFLLPVFLLSVCLTSGHPNVATTSAKPDVPGSLQTKPETGSPPQSSRRDESGEAKRHKHSATTRIVDTQYGRLKGMVLAVDLPSPQRTERIEAFLGIQYASLLGSELRFMPPTGPMEKWDGIKVVNKFRPVCPQHVPDLEEVREKVSPLELERLKLLRPFVAEQQEECLNMNIYVPRRERKNPKTNCFRCPRNEYLKELFAFKTKSSGIFRRLCRDFLLQSVLLP